MSRYLARYGYFPKELFRLNNSLSVRLRDRAVKRTGSFDVVTEAGKMKPKAIDPTTYQGPNGASMRPNTQAQKDLVENYTGSQVVRFSIPQGKLDSFHKKLFISKFAGTKLPEDLTLIHEKGDHNSLQPAKEMTLEGKSNNLIFLRQASY
ncbi:hypothetical protein PDIG_47210 [Penicillium digitatum PHI26]|uniref:Tse2 ADP-ribosyltransferase toxin domain-containing protein n=2 Tax=Penicillium digitatum TaxID=36651 RepID=K9GFF1_PEND2|nr:hypothetical protein PDIP_16390 [Penicillium digitatum Pd1]EKV12006.1 hypothetical protein PDIG_47210 [Penicillium digitatum PHI26]EKV20448.1 hypothetical protein PDIP_16390 [Penicillium digitatum Pd1]